MAATVLESASVTTTRPVASDTKLLVTVKKFTTKELLGAHAADHGLGDDDGTKHCLVVVYPENNAKPSRHQILRQNAKAILRHNFKRMQHECGELDKIEGTFPIDDVSCEYIGLVPKVHANDIRRYVEDQYPAR